MHGTVHSNLSRAGVLILATGVRLWAVTQPIYHDERITLRFLALSYPDLLIELPTRQPHFPPYYLLVRVLSDFTGTSFLTLRWLSVLAGVALVALTMRVGRAWFDEPTGVRAGLLLAVAPPLVIQSGWLRMYALLCVAVLVSWWALATALDAETPRAWWLWVASTGVVIWLHPFGLFVAAGQVAYLVVEHDRIGRPTVGLVLLSLPAVALLVLKLLGSARVVDPVAVASTANLIHLRTPPGPLRLAGLPGALFVGRLFTATQALTAAAVGVLLVRVGVRASSRPYPRLLLWWVLTPVCAAVLASYLARPVFQLKYLTFITPALALLVSVELGRWDRRPRRVALGVLLFVQLFAIGLVGMRAWLALRVF